MNNIDKYKLIQGETEWHYKYNELIESLNNKFNNMKLYHIGPNPPDNKQTIWIKTINRKDDI